MLRQEGLARSIEPHPASGAPRHSHCMFRLLCVLLALTTGVAAAGGGSAPPTHPYQTISALLKTGKLGEARLLAVNEVQRTAANLPPCVQGGSPGSLFTVFFRPGEALTLLTSVGGGRVNAYEIRPDGIHRTWQAKRTSTPETTSRLARMLGADMNGPACGTPPVLNGPLEAYTYSPFTGSLFVDIITPGGTSHRCRAVNLDREISPGRYQFRGLTDSPTLDSPEHCP